MRRRVTPPPPGDHGEDAVGTEYFSYATIFSCSFTSVTTCTTALTAVLRKRTLILSPTLILSSANQRPLRLARPALRPNSRIPQLYQTFEREFRLSQVISEHSTN